MIRFDTDTRPDLDAIRALYAAAPLRRPIDNPDRLRRMFEGSNVVLSAWDGERLVGLLRGWTDGAFDGYVCDLAVHPAYQRSGVGKGLLALIGPAHPEVRWVLGASPLAKHYYAHLGWEAVNNAWALPRPGQALPDYESFVAQHAGLAALA